MKLSTINNFLKDETLYVNILNEFGVEIEEYTKRSNIKGASMPVILIEDINNVIIGKNELKVLCNAYLKGYISETQLNYIVDAMQLSQMVEFENENIEDAFSLLTDPEVNGKLSKDGVIDILIKNS